MVPPDVLRAYLEVMVTMQEPMRRYQRWLEQEGGADETVRPETGAEQSQRA
jgi:hypothetical protein